MSNQPEDTHNQMATAVVGELLDTTLEKVNGLQQRIDAALDTAAIENDYKDIALWGAGIVALDLIENSKEFEDERPSSLIPRIRSWQERNGGNLVTLTWPTGPHRTEEFRVPKKVIAMAEEQLIKRLMEQLSAENKRANVNAMETIRLGRQLSITSKALESVAEVLKACQRLRRFDGTDDGNPLNAAAKGYLCLQDSKDLDDAIAKALQHLQQLEKEYPAKE